MKEGFRTFLRRAMNALLPAIFICSGVEWCIKFGDTFWWKLIGFLLVVMGIIDIYDCVDKERTSIARDVDISKREIAQLFKLVESRKDEET